MAQKQTRQMDEVGRSGVYPASSKDAPPTADRVTPGEFVHHRGGGGSGISNRESPGEEARERREHPPLDPSSADPEDAGGRVGEQPLDDTRDRHTSHKAGSRSIAQKEAGSRYPDRSTPASRKVAGAFGKEPK
jgi:hypothetical protein